MDLYPTSTLLRRLEERGQSWPSVAADLEEPELITPVKDNPTRRRLTGHEYVGYAEPLSGVAGEAYVIVGVGQRERPAPGLAEPVVGIESPSPRSSRRGGSGRRWPTTWGELSERLTAIEGVTIEDGSTHLIVKRDGNAIDTLPKTASEYRGLLNACTQLRRKGLDVSRTGEVA